MLGQGELEQVGTVDHRAYMGPCFCMIWWPQKARHCYFHSCICGYKWGTYTPECVTSCWESSAVLEEHVVPESLLWPSWKITFCHNSQAQYLPVFFFVCFRSIFYGLRDKRSGILCSYPWIEFKTLGVCELNVENNFFKGFFLKCFSVYFEKYLLKVFLPLKVKTA